MNWPRLQFVTFLVLNVGTKWVDAYAIDFDKTVRISASAFEEAIEVDVADSDREEEDDTLDYVDGRTASMTPCRHHGPAIDGDEFEEVDWESDETPPPFTTL